MNQEIKDFTDYLQHQVATHAIYVWGGQGQYIVDILPDLTSMENTDRVDQILTLISQNLKKYSASGQFDMMTSQAFDCSGLGTYYFIKNGFIKGDTTADGLYNDYSEHIRVEDLQEGDMVFQKGTNSKGEIYMKHVGYYVGNGKVIEDKGRKYGVVKTDLATGGWTNYGRPIWWASDTFVLKRELRYVKDNLMRGTDVETVQKRLNELGFNCGKADGIFGTKTKGAVQSFQRSVKLDDDGIVGKKTCEALGFIWAG